MPREEMKKYLDILELGPSASLSDVKNAYSRLKKLYSEDSLALAPLADEFPEKKRKRSSARSKKPTSSSRGHSGRSPPSRFERFPPS